MLEIKSFVCNPFQENCYVVSDETKEAVIVDCGAFYKEERKAIVGYIRDNGLTPKHLIATHAHIDHNFGNNTIYDEFRLSPEVFYKDEYLMGKLYEQAVNFCNYHLDYEMPQSIKYLHETDTIVFGNHEFTIIPTPGHTPGSVFYYCKEEGLAFSGDTLFRMSIGRTDFELGSYADIQKSLADVTSRLPLSTTILAGHGPSTTIEDEVRMNPFIERKM